MYRCGVGFEHRKSQLLCHYLIPFRRARQGGGCYQATPDLINTRKSRPAWDENNATSINVQSEILIKLITQDTKRRTKCKKGHSRYAVLLIFFYNFLIHFKTIESSDVQKERS